jgi:hypothetical protein
MVYSWRLEMALTLVCLFPAPTVSAQSVTSRVIHREEILAAMRASVGFDPSATTNGARFQAEVLLRLAREAAATDGSGRPLFLSHADWFSAYLERTGLTAEKAPAFVWLGNEYGQDLELEYGIERVVLRVLQGPTPTFALNVRIGWPAKVGKPDEYSYEDLLATPKLRVTNRRSISYRLLDYGDVIVFDQVQGLLGRPTSGLLGVLFKVIGEGHVTESRMLVSPDGLQIARARAAKGIFTVQSTVTVYPDGRTEKDLPMGRPDLLALESRLKQPRSIEYRRPSFGADPR